MHAQVTILSVLIWAPGTIFIRSSIVLDTELLSI